MPQNPQRKLLNKNIPVSYRPLLGPEIQIQDQVVSVGAQGAARVSAPGHSYPWPHSSLTFLSPSSAPHTQRPLWALLPTAQHTQQPRRAAPSPHSLKEQATAGAPARKG